MKVREGTAKEERKIFSSHVVMMLSNSQCFCLGFRPGAERASFNSTGQSVSAIAALSCISQPTAAPHGLSHRWGKDELHFPMSAPKARLSPHTDPVTHLGEGRQRHGEEAQGPALPVVRAGQTRSRAVGRRVPVEPYPKARQASSGVGRRAPGKGVVSEPRIEKDHGLVICKNESKPHQIPRSSQGRYEPALVQLAQRLKDSNVVTCKIKSVQLFARLWSWDSARLTGLGAEPAFCIKPKPSQTSSTVLSN